jgi:uncharacterized membrane protein
LIPGPGSEPQGAATVASDAGSVAAPGTAVAAAARLESIDFVRGLVMVLMALDHVRDHVHRGATLYDPSDLSRASAALFLTRWITHFCAPVFVFLAGTGTFLWAARGRTSAQTSRHLLIRGLWLILLEITVVNAEWQFGPTMRTIIAQVIWALGWSMVVLAALVRLPRFAIFAVGSLMIVGHNLFDGVRPEALGSFGNLWRVLHVQGPIPWGHGNTLQIVYPLVPWIGVMAVGYAFGGLYAQPAAARRGPILAWGALLTLGFVALRALDAYGDPGPWSPQQDVTYTVLSFLNCQKYPPSLLYLLMTLGPALLLLGALEGGIPKLGRWLIVFGRVPLFYYVVHLLVIDLLSIVFAVAQYGARTPDAFANGPPADYGHSLGVVYLVWIALVAALYPLCRWYAGVKARSRARWASYL